MDNKFNKVMNRIGKIFLVNILWLICSIPVITVGASTCAAFYVLLKIVDDKDVQIFKGFFKAFKQNFVQGTITWAFTVPCGYALFLMWKIVIDGEGNFFGTAGTVLFSILVIFVFLYTYPMIARYENSLKRIFKNSLSVAIQYLVGTIITAAIVIAIGFVFSISRLTMIVGVLIGPGLIFYVIAKSAKNIFNNLEAAVKAESTTESAEVSTEE